MTTEQEQWETVDVPRGAYLSWGEKPGQFVTGRVLDYSPAGGTNFAGEVCPQLSIELREPAASINKAGQRTDFPAGELVVLNCGLVSLKRAVQVAALNQGDLVKITLLNLTTTSKGTVKEFDIKVARGAGKSPTQTASRPAANPSGTGWDAQPAAGGEPPF